MKHTVSELILPNGIRGLLVHIPDAQVMNFELNFRAGEYLVEEKKWEVPHLMEHILLGANTRFPRARDFQAEIEKNGAYSNASTSVYDITYEAECADFEWERVLELLIVSITEPLFLREEFTAEFGNVREELTARANNHFRHLSLALARKLRLFGQNRPGTPAPDEKRQTQRRESPLRVDTHLQEYALCDRWQHHTQAAGSHRTTLWHDGVTARYSPD